MPPFKCNFASEWPCRPKSSSYVSADLIEVDDIKQYVYARAITIDFNHEVMYRIKTTVTLRRLKESYCNTEGLNIKKINFWYKDQRITDNDTPKSLGMNNSAIILVQANCDFFCNCKKSF